MKRNRIKTTMVCLLCMLLCIPSTYINAETTTSDATTQAPAYESSQGVDASFLQNDAKIPYIGSKSVVLMDAATGEILYQKNPTKKCHPASTTKCITSLLACEKGNMSDVITYSDTAIFGVEAGSSGVALDVGEQLTLEQSLYALMLESANEAANGIAEYVGGSIDEFAKMMTQKVKDLGGKKSNFVNPNGLYNKDHYSCAYDMALVVREALKNENWRKFSSSTYYNLPPTNKQELPRYWYNHHKMLNNSPGYEYSGIEGGKTGYTVQSNYSLVSYAKRGDLELICICMNNVSSPGIYNDTKNLFDFGFDNFSILKPEASLESTTDDALDIIQNNYKTFFPSSLLNFSTDPNSSDGALVVSNTADTSKITGNFKVAIDYKAKQLGIFEFTCDDNIVATTNVYFSASGLTSKYTGDPEVLKKIYIRNCIITIACIILFLLVFFFILLKIAKKRGVNLKRKLRKSKTLEFSSNSLPLTPNTTKELDSIITQDAIAKKQDSIRLRQEQRHRHQEELRARNLAEQKARAELIEAERKAKLLAQEKEIAYKEEVKQKRLREMEQFKKEQEQLLLQQQMQQSNSSNSINTDLPSDSQVYTEKQPAESNRRRKESKNQQKDIAKDNLKAALVADQKEIDTQFSEKLLLDESDTSTLNKKTKKKKQKRTSTISKEQENEQRNDKNSSSSTSSEKNELVTQTESETSSTPDEPPVIQEIIDRPKKRKFEYNVQATNLNGSFIKPTTHVPVHKQVSELTNTANAIADAEKVLSNINKGNLSGTVPTTEENQALTETIDSLMDAVTKATESTIPSFAPKNSIEENDKKSTDKTDKKATETSETPNKTDVTNSKKKELPNSKDISLNKDVEKETKKKQGNGTQKQTVNDKDKNVNTSSISNINVNNFQDKTEVINNDNRNSSENVDNSSVSTIKPDTETKQALSNRKIFKPEVDVSALSSSITEKKASSVFSVFGKKKSQETNEVNMGYVVPDKKSKKK